MLSFIGMKNSYIQVFKSNLFTLTVTSFREGILQLHQLTHLGCDIQIAQELQNDLYQRHIHFQYFINMNMQYDQLFQTILVPTK